MDKVGIINEFFSSRPALMLSLPFYPLEDGALKGEIVLSTVKGVVNFVVIVPKEYPFTNKKQGIRFISHALESYTHTNSDGSLCFASVPKPSIEEKLQVDFEHLLVWLDRYYVNESQDERYEYLVHAIDTSTVMLYSDINASFTKGEFGYFKYTVIHSYKANDGVLVQDLLLLQELKSVQLPWSNLYSSQNSNVGLWTFIKDEPIRERRKIVANWDELSVYLPQKFLTLLHSLKKEKKNIKSHLLKSIPVLIGYELPSVGSRKEIHWQLISLELNNIPTYGEKVNGDWIGRCENIPVHYGRTLNCSYDRMFGRGGLVKQFADSKILIIGTGAIGSQLAEILVRGGLKRLTLMDYDELHPGNLCRGSFDLSGIGIPKIYALGRHLHSISLYIQVDFKSNNEYFLDKSLDNSTLNENRSFLDAYDYIFDCTTDNELAFILDKIESNAKILNLSISNRAKEFTCITGANVSKTKAFVYSKIIQEPPAFFEGIGCASPTFEAAFFDLASPLNLAVKHVNNAIRDNKAIPSFVIAERETDRGIMYEIIEY